MGKGSASTKMRRRTRRNRKKKRDARKVEETIKARRG